MEPGFGLRIWTGFWTVVATIVALYCFLRAEFLLGVGLGVLIAVVAGMLAGFSIKILRLRRRKYARSWLGLDDQRDDRSNDPR